MKRLLRYCLLLLVTYTVQGKNLPMINHTSLVKATNWHADPSIYAFSSPNICIFDSVLLSVSNLPSDAIGYIWQKDGVNINGATKIPFPAKSAGLYTLAISLANGSVFITNSITVTIAPQSIAPVISARGATTFCNGQSVVLASSDPGNLQWQKDGIGIIDANSQTFTATVGGNYRIKYTPTTGCPGYSNDISVTVTNVVGPTITESIHPVPVCIGTSFRITSSVVGVQWQKDGVNIIGATNQFLDVIDNGKYRAVQLNNGGGCSAFSNEITVTSFLPIQPTPTIIANSATTFCSGSSVILSSSVPSGSGAVVQWRLNGVDIIGATNQTYTAIQSGTYTAYIAGSSRYCNNTGTPSNAILVTVNASPTAPVVTAGGNLTFCAGSSITFTSNISDIQWQRNGIDIIGSTGTNYIANQSGIYRAILRGLAGCDGISNAYTVNVLTPNVTPTVTLAGSNNICAGSTAVLTSNVGNVQWQKDGVDISGAVFQSYVANQTGTYRAYIPGSLGCGANYSNGITIIVNGVVAIPVINAATSLTFCSGNNVILQSTVTNVQWQLNGINIGSIGAAFSATQSGSYTAVATNGTCSATSNTLIVTVVSPLAAPIIAATGATTFCNGSTVSFTSNVANVQWQKDGVDISGATFQAYTAALPGVYRAYQRTVINCGIAYSNAIMVTVNTTPTPALITPSGVTSFCSGGSVTLNASIYPVQWRLNGIDIGTVTSIPLVVNNSGTYSATTINGTCTSSSNTILVTVSTPSSAPVITAASTTNICIGTVATLSSSINGVQWQKDGIDIAGATFQAYNASQSGVYRAYVPGSAVCGTNYSNSITVIVSAPPPTPSITGSSSLNLCTGGSVILSSTLPIIWQRDGITISNNPTQTITVSSAGTYRGTVTNGGCIALSNALVVTVATNVAPVISAVGGNAVICSNSGLVLTSTIANVQWQLNGVNIIGANAQTYTTNVVGNYTAITVGGCNVLSNSLAVVVGTAPVAPTISANGSVNVCSGGNVTLTASTAPVQWQKDGIDIIGSTSQNLVITTTGSYRAYTTNGSCTAPSNSIIVTISNTAAPTVSLASGSLTICSGGTGAVLGANIAGVQWQLNGVNISGATSQTYVATAAGTYSVIANGSNCTSTNSLNVIVTSAPIAPVIATTAALSFCNGDSITLVSNIAGVQWFKDGVTITGATNQTLVVTQSGKYRATFTNTSNCSAISNELAVAVNFPAIIPTISTNNNLSICSGTTATLVSNIAGVTWQRDGVVVATNTSTYIASIAGNYRAIILGGTCTAFSNVLTVAVTPSLAAPTIVPSGPTIFCDNDSVVLVSNFANGQWYRNGVIIVGATGSTYTAKQGGIYKVLASNNTCTAFSNEITITVNSPAIVPSIVASGATTICSGTPLTLTSNNGNILWQKDGLTIASGVQNISITESGTYRAILFGTGCPGFSNAIVVSVSPSPGTPFVTATGSTTFCDSNSLILVSTLPNVQWQKDGVNLPNAITQTLTVNKSGKYRAFVSNNVCINYSSEINVVVNTPPIVPTIIASGNLNICDGTSVTLTSNVAGVIWQKDFVTIATNTQSIIATSAGNYRAIILSSTCPAYSSAVTVFVTPSPIAPTITALGNTTFCDSGFVTLASNVSGVQWLAGGNIIQNAFSQNYTATKSGIYTAVLYGNNGCNAVSNPITVTVTPAAITPTIANTSSSNSFCAGASTNLVSSVIDVIWQKDGLTISNSGNNSQVLKVTESGVYRAVYVKSGCPGYSNAIAVTAIPQPLSPIVYRVTQNQCDTGNVVIASTLNVANMQWQKDSIDIIGATGATYTAKESGNYRMVILLPNACPSYSQNLPVVINTALIPVIIWDGSVFKTFTKYTTYQWYLNNNPIPGATSNIYKPTEAGKYKVVVTASINCVFTSDVFQLLVTAVTTPTLINGATVKQYPNPTTSDAWIEFSQVPTKPVTVRLLSVSGAVLQTIQSRQRRINIPTANYANGLYFIEVNGTEGKIIYKLIVNK